MVFNASTGADSSQALQTELEKKFGQSPVFIASTLVEKGGVPKDASSTALLKEAIHVITCGYEDKTEWGKEVSDCCFVCICWATTMLMNALYRLAGFMDLLQKIS